MWKGTALRECQREMQARTQATIQTRGVPEGNGRRDDRPEQPGYHGRTQIPGGLDQPEHTEPVAAQALRNA